MKIYIGVFARKHFMPKKKLKSNLSGLISGNRKQASGEK